MNVADQVENALQTKLLPKLVAVYQKQGNFPIQIGTAFLIRFQNNPVLVTAKHVLEGHQGYDDPFDKAVFVDKKLKLISDISTSKIVYSEENDICIVRVNGFQLNRCFELSDLDTNYNNASVIGIAGFLSRDFIRKRRENSLSVKPYIHIDERVGCKGDYVGMRYSRRCVSKGKNIAEKTPIPKGLSGSPMIEPMALLENKFKLVGVFTEERKVDGYVFGEPIHKLTPLFEELMKPEFTSSRV